MNVQHCDRASQWTPSTPNRTFTQAGLLEDNVPVLNDSPPGGHSENIYFFYVISTKKKRELLGLLLVKTLCHTPSIPCVLYFITPRTKSKTLNPLCLDCHTSDFRNIIHEYIWNGHILISHHCYYIEVNELVYMNIEPWVVYYR